MIDHKKAQNKGKIEWVDVDGIPAYHLKDESGNIIETIKKGVDDEGSAYYQRHGKGHWITQDEARDEGITLSSLPKKNK